MLICPIEGAALFSSCPVSTCMWHKGVGGCDHGNVTDRAYLDPEIPDDVPLIETRGKILHYITVGAFLEATSGKELAALNTKDFPPEAKFQEWCKSKSVKSSKTIHYTKIIQHIKQEL